MHTCTYTQTHTHTHTHSHTHIYTRTHTHIQLDISLISEKVSHWLTVCCKLEKTLPAMDPVLEGWRERLTELQRQIPLLQQLSSKALRVCTTS